MALTPLPPVVLQDPHVAAHNTERTRINDLIAEITSGRLSIDDLNSSFGPDAVAAEMLNPSSDLYSSTSTVVSENIQPSVASLVPGEVADAVDGHVPGSSLGYVERASSYVVTNVAPALAASTAMGLTVTGAGRPVELEFYVPEIYHSVVGTRVVIGIAYQRDSIYQGNLRYVSKRSYSDTEGDQMIVKSQLMLTSGHEYFFYPVFGAFAAGTTSLKVSGAAGGPVMTMSAVSR